MRLLSPPPISLKSRALFLKAAFMVLGLFLSFASFGQTYIITQPTVWTTNVSASRIEIRPGGSLTITNGAVVDMAPGNSTGVIQVYPETFPNTNKAGGKLIVDNGTIYANGYNLWYGISVMGNRHPNDPLGGTSQNWQPISQSDKRMAKAYFKNASVSNTRFGVCNFDIAYGAGGAPYTGGGVIQAISSTFSNNNNYAIWMQHYRNFIKIGNQTHYLNDQSYFHKNTFKHTVASIGTPYSAFMALHEVNGISVLGNSFTVTQGKAFPFTGILIQNAGVNVDEFCTSPYLMYGARCPSAIPNVFKNVQNAISTESWAQNGSYRINIQHTTFDDCRNGINLSNTSQAYLVENYFKSTPDYNNNHAAIFLGGSTGYKVEGNIIDVTSPNSNSKTYGVSVKSSGAAPNTVYRNTVKNANYALQGVDLNRNTGNFSAEGLRFLCNNMSNTVPDAYDVTVLPSPQATITGIAGFQSNFVNGSPAVAGNTFSSLNNSNGPRNYVNNGLPLVYVGYIPPLGYNGNVSLASGPAYGCPATTGIGRLPLNAVAFNTQKTNLELAITQNRANNPELMAQYAQLHYDMLDSYYGAWDTTGRQNLDSAIWVLGNAKYLHTFRIQKASLQATKGSWNDALSTLSGISGAFTLSAPEQAEVTQLISVYGVGSFLASHNLDWSTVSAGDQQNIRNIAGNGLGVARYAARYYLSVYENGRFEPEVEAIGGTSEMNNSINEAARPGESTESGTIAKMSGLEKIAVYPNPTLNGEVNISGVANGTHYTVKDITGRVLLSGNLTAETNMISLKPFATGIYTLQLMDGANKVSTFKISRP